MGASSGEWRSEPTPTTDCEALWTLGLRVFLQEIKEYSLKTFSVVFATQIVKRIYIIYESKQSRVVERSDTDDRLQSALDARLRNSSPENTEKIATKQVMMARHISIYV